MLVTLIQDRPRTGAALTIDVCLDQAEAVICAMATNGWLVVSKQYGPTSPVVDCVQIALLEVSTMPRTAPLRVAVELGASAAKLSAPMLPGDAICLSQSTSGWDRH